MKVPTTVVMEFFKELRLQALGVIDTIRCGDDGFEQSCKEQVNDMLKAMDVFRVERLTPMTKLKKDNSKAYKTELPQGDDIHGFSVGDNVAIYKYRLYNHLKRRLPELDLMEISTSKLSFHIEEALLYSSPYGKDAWSKEWFYATQHVLDDLADEIANEREKAPQLSLFKTR